MPPPDIPASPLFLPFLLLILRLIPASNGLVDRHMDCQANEQFMQCGTCEGSCRDPIVAKCRNECKPPRCECQSKMGFVRAHDGACIHVHECSTYKGAYFGSGGQLVSGQGVVSQTAPKTVLNHLKPASGGAGFGLGGAGEGEEEQNGNDLQQPEDLSAPLLPPLPNSPIIPTPASPPLQSSFTTRIPSPPSISPPNFQPQTPPQLVPDQAPPNPDFPSPAIFRHRDNGGIGGGGRGTIPSKQSQMNLFADLSESRGSEANAGIEPSGRNQGAEGTAGQNANTNANILQPRLPLAPNSNNFPGRPQHLPSTTQSRHPSSPIRQHHFQPPAPPNSPPTMLHPIPPPQPNAPTYSAPSFNSASSSASNLPKFDAFGVGNQLTIQNANGVQGALGDGGTSSFRGKIGSGNVGGNIGGGRGGGDYGQQKVLQGPRIDSQKQQQDSPLEQQSKCGIRRGCKNREEDGGGGGIGEEGRQNALTSGANWRSLQRLRTKNQPYLYAYVNPPMGELEANGVITQQDMMGQNLRPPSSRIQNGGENENLNDGRQFEQREAPNWPAEEAEANIGQGNDGIEEKRQPGRNGLNVRQQKSTPPESLLIPPLPANLRIYRQKRLFRQRRRRK